MILSLKKETEALGYPDVKKMPAKDTSAIYIHIPFCKRECYYCNFTKFKYEEDSAKKYADLLCSELEMRKNSKHEINTVYFGGGSPAVIPAASLEKIIVFLNDNFRTDIVTEMTIEINPEECNKEKLNFFKDLGFNRVSVGVQSFYDPDLRYLSRNHSGAIALEAVKTVLKTGFDSVSVDFIIGIPGQEIETLEKNISIITSSDVNHVSAYLLEGVKEFGNRPQPDADHQSYIYDIFREKISEKGFEQYEISNYSRDGNISKHNMNYWESGNYIGAGLSASGYEDEIDYTNHSNMGDYGRSVRNNIIPVKERTKNDPLKRALVTGLRLSKGIEKDKFAFYEPGIRKLIEEGFLEEMKNSYRVIPSRMVVLNEILSYLI